MADNDQNNDEYKFAELDSLGNEPTENPEYDFDSPPASSSSRPVGASKVNIKRNAMIAVGVIVFIMLMYKFVGGMFSSKSTTPAPDTSVADIASPQPIQTEIPSEPIQLQTQPIQPVVQENTVLQQKVASIEVTQKNVQSDVTSVSRQVGNVNNNVNTLSTQISKLNQVISDLSNQVAKQSAEINVLMDRTKPKPVKRIVRPPQVNEQIIYFINAVIPGRAWLIGTNGSTLTVREGSKVAGYGVVKLIDSMQGRVLTSSGRVIRFSQEDS